MLKKTLICGKLYEESGFTFSLRARCANSDKCRVCNFPGSFFHIRVGCQLSYNSDCHFCTFSQHVHSISGFSPFVLNHNNCTIFILWLFFFDFCAVFVVFTRFLCLFVVFSGFCVVFGFLWYYNIYN